MNSPAYPGQTVVKSMEIQGRYVINWRNTSGKEVHHQVHIGEYKSVVGEGHLLWIGAQ